MLTEKDFFMDIYIQFSPHTPTIFCIHKRQDALHDNVRNHIFSAHVFTGCDTVSALHNICKRKALSILDNRKIDWDMLNVFVDQNAKKDDIAQTGEVFLLKLYGSTHCTSLYEHRYYLYMKQVSRKSLTSR